MSILEEAKTLTDDLTDHNDVTAAGFDRVIPQEGTGFARLVSIVELGTHPQSFEGNPTKPALEIRLGFEFLDEKHLREIEVDEVKKTVGVMHYEKMTLKLNEKATFYKLFKKLQAGTDVKNITGLLDQPFVFKVEHNKSKDGKTTYANIRSKLEGWLVLDKMRDVYGKDGTADEERVIGTRDRTANVVPATFKHQLFSVEKPTLQQWESIFIDGTRTVKKKQEDGSTIEVEQTKNWVQEVIMSSLDWKGSAMEALLLNLEVDTQPEVVKEETPKKSKAGSKKAANEDTAKVEEDTDAMLAELGM